MKVTNPQPFLDAIDWDQFEKALGLAVPETSLEYSEPSPVKSSNISIDLYKSGESALPTKISGKVQRFGDNIDTDSVTDC